MATYTSDVTNDPFGPMQLYKPDYQFLTQVYGTGQAEFDRGFNYVKSLYNSKLNDLMTSQDNQKHRQAVFKKISESLKDATTLDLSNTANIEYATKLIEPISKDREFAYDMAFSRRQQDEAQKLEAVRTSLDPKISSQYNDFSRRAIEFANQDMRNAKRGDGSILKIAPQEFIPFQDVVADLNKAAAEQKLDIHIEQADHNGYIIKQSNGKLAYKPYTNWALQAIGNKYDRQFQQQGYVEAESLIRGKMSQNGLERADAIRSFIPTIAKKLATDAVDDDNNANERLREINLKIQVFKDKYSATGINPNSQAAKELKKLYEEKNNYTSELTKVYDEKIKLSEDPEGYITNNLYNIFTNQAKKSTALNWAINQANVTSKIEIDPDTTWATVFNQKSENVRFEKDLRYKYTALKQKILDDQAARENERLKLIYGDGKMPYQKTIGKELTDIRNADGSLPQLPGVNLLHNDLDATQEEIVNGTLAPAGGLINLIYDSSKNDKATISPILNRIKQIAAGQNVKLNSQDLKTLVDFGNRTGLKIINPSNPANAGYMLRQLSYDVYNKSMPVLEAYKKSGQSAKIADLVKNYSSLRNSFKKYIDLNNTVEQNYDNLANVIIDKKTHQIKPEYAGVKLMGYTSKGKPIFDVSNLSSNTKLSLDKFLTSQYKNRNTPSGAVLDMINIPSEVYHQFINYNTNMTNDEKKKLALSDEKIKELFGQNGKIRFDLYTQEAVMSLNIDEAKLKENASLDKSKKTYEFRLPYSHIKANSAILKDVARYIDDNTVKSSQLTELESLRTNMNNVVHAPRELKHLGLDYQVYSGKNAQGVPGVYITGKALNPATHHYEPFEHFAQGDPSDEKTLQTVENILDTCKSQYASVVIQHDKTFKETGQVVNYDDYVNALK